MTATRTETDRRCPIPAGLLHTINADPMDDTARLVAADWCQDNGHSRQGYGYGVVWSWCEDQLRQGPPPLGLCFFGYGYGDGDGYGDGYGYGDGDGDGSGYGYGYGDGSGYGYGDGYGYRVILKLNGGRIVPEIEKNQLVILPHGWVICGFVREQTGPYQFRVENAVLICRTGGVPWDELADGGRRELATYRKWGDVNIGPQFVMSREWKGKLPEVTS